MTTGPLIYGVDLSQYQRKGTYNLGPVKDAGYLFAIIKVSEGTTYKDPAAVELAAACRDAGIRIGAYHYFWNTLDIARQAKNYLEAVAAAGPFDLPIADAMDVEEKRLAGTKVQAGDNLFEMLHRLEGETGRRPAIYTSQWYWQTYIAPRAEWSSYPLWVASYPNSLIGRALSWIRTAMGRYGPSIPSSWSKTGWYCWQFGSQIDVPFFGQIDADVMSPDYGNFPPVPLSSYKVTASWLTIRVGPQYLSLPAGFLKGGDIVTVYAVVNGWGKISLMEQRWVSMRYLALQPSTGS